MKVSLVNKGDGLLQKYGLFIIVICNKVLSQSLLFMNSDNFQ